MINQKQFTEEVLFSHYMPSNIKENYIHSQIPFYLDTDTYNKMVFYSETINTLCLNILSQLNTKHKKLVSYIDNFPLRGRIFSLNCSISPLLWTRFDTFRNNKGNILFAEMNYDKPCAQKEIGLAGSIDFDGNVNKFFEKSLISRLLSICEAYCKSRANDEKVTIAFLIDPCHYEEFHISYYLKDLCTNTQLNILQVGPKNLSVKEGKVFAFDDKKIDVILRLFPTEYLHEVNNIDEILNCFENGDVLILNDPRVIAIQAKSLFAYLWELVESNSSLITREEAEVIRKCIPYTTIFSNESSEAILRNKDAYVVKSSFGRYSGEVYIGRLFSKNEWKVQLSKVESSTSIHIVQDVIDIKQEYTYHVDDNLMNVPCKAYGNFGTFILGDKVEGICVRWSNTFLTDNSTTWMSPIGIKDYPIKLWTYDFPNRKEIWDKVIERTMFEYNFTGQFFNTGEYVSLNSLILNEWILKEIEDVSSKYCSVLDKTSKFIQENFDIFSKFLGIPQSLKELVLNSHTDMFCAIGRIDFVLDNDGNLKILEFNSETPAGIVESIGIQKIIQEELGITGRDVNKNLREDIKRSFTEILKSFSLKENIKNIGFVCTSYYEDWYNTGMLMEICKEIGVYNVFLGNIYDLEVSDEKLYLYGNELDAVYRYFPLDYLAYEKELEDVLRVLNKKTFSINPTHTLITQSKAIHCVIYELINKGFYTKEEEDFILKYIPYSCLEPDEKLSVDCLAKPLLSREGQGIIMSYEGIEKGLEDIIFQERVNTKPFEMVKYNTICSESKFHFPVIGVYITGSKPSGIFTRMGDFVTNESASFVTTFTTEEARNNCANGCET